MTTENKEILETKRLLQGLAERVFQTQCEVGLWDADEVKQDPKSVMLDFLLLSMHAKLSTIHQLDGSDDFDAVNPERDEIAELLVEGAIELLGAAQMRTSKAGEMVLNTVVLQARQAREMLKDLPGEAVEAGEDGEDGEDGEADEGDETDGIAPETEDILQAAIKVARASFDKPKPPTE